MISILPLITSSSVISLLTTFPAMGVTLAAIHEYAYEIELKHVSFATSIQTNLSSIPFSPIVLHFVIFEIIISNTCSG